MRCFTFDGGKVSVGLNLTTDPKLGQVVFLGESGRGRHYEKVALCRRNPAEVVSGKVIEANPKKITLEAKEGKPEKSFYVLEKPRNGDDGRVLVRVNTSWCYTKNSCGSWSTVEGQPETLIVGFGAHGDAGRIGNWDDGLVVMRPGDVLKVRPEGGHKTQPWALWVNEKGEVETVTWKDWENLKALEQAEAAMAEAANDAQALPLVCGEVPCFTFNQGKIEPGLKVIKGATGLVVGLGEHGRGRKFVEIPLVGIETELIETAAVAKLSEEVVPPRYSWDQPTTKVVYGLVRGVKAEPGTVLLRINTSWCYTRNSTGKWEAWKGNPQTVVSGFGAHGEAGGIGHWEDGLVLLHEGDVLYVSPEGGYKTPNYALFLRGGQPVLELWFDWKLADLKRNPEFYVAKGLAPIERVPAEWIGRVVTVQGIETYEGKKSFVDRETGELVAVSPLTLNYGWETGVRQEGGTRHTGSVQVKLEAEKQVKRLSEEESADRAEAEKAFEACKADAQKVCESPYFQVLSEELQKQLSRAARGLTHWDGLIQNLYQLTNPEIKSWVETSKQALAQAQEAAVEAEKLRQKQDSGEILVRFNAWHRRGGMSGNGDGWVIQPDGSLRQHDSDDVARHKSDGIYCWDRVSEEELALQWSCGTMHDVAGSSGFIVAKLPVGGCTEAQLEAVARIEDELGAPRNAFGLHKEMQEVYDRRIEAIRSACQKSRILHVIPADLNYLTVSGKWGKQVKPDDVNGQISDYVDWNGAFSESCENREAQIVDTVPAADGVLEFLAYEKFGGDNLNIRWRPFREGEGERKTEPEPETLAEPLTTETLATGLSALKAKFGKK